MPKGQAIAWVLFVAISLGAGLLGSVATASSVGTWYPQLVKPAGTPPSWVFGPVWTTLYVFMGTAAWLVWRQHEVQSVRMALVLFFTQLALNLAWSLIFFGLRRPGIALVEILVLLAAIVLTAFAFRPISRAAFWLMTPYIAWVTYATYLNLGLWRLNR
jgi:translocator protein